MSVKATKNICCVKDEGEVDHFTEIRWFDSWLVGFYGISTFVGYLTPNPFLCK